MRPTLRCLHRRRRGRALSAQERGDILMARKMYREAIDTYKEAPETAILMNKIGIAYHQLTDLAAAAKVLLRAR